MSQLYGCWLKKDFVFESIRENKGSLHEEYYPFFLRRLDSVCAIAEIFKSEIESIFPKLNGKLIISYPAAISAIGRYINDIMHYKLWHDVKIANKAKMIAHTIKWLSHYPLISVNVNADEYFLLSDVEKSAVLEMNSLFIGAVIRYYLAYFCNGDIPSSKRYDKVFYLLETGQYDAKNASVAFDGIIL